MNNHKLSLLALLVFSIGTLSACSAVSAGKTASRNIASEPQKCVELGGRSFTVPSSLKTFGKSEDNKNLTFYFKPKKLGPRQSEIALMTITAATSDEMAAYKDAAKMLLKPGLTLENGLCQERQLSAYKGQWSSQRNFSCQVFLDNFKVDFVAVSTAGLDKARINTFVKDLMAQGDCN